MPSSLARDMPAWITRRSHAGIRVAPIRPWRCVMLQVIAAVVALLLSPGDAPAQTPPDRPAAGVNRETGAPGSAGPKDDGVVQRGGQPNAGEVRPGNRDGDTPSASAGELR